MGIIVPRPAMRRREARIVTARLASHKRIMRILVESGIEPDQASRMAFNIVRPQKGKLK